MESSIEALIAAYHAVWNGANPEELGAILHAGFCRIADPLSESATGVAATKALVRKMRLDMPDLNTVIIDSLYLGDRAATRWRLSGTDSGPGDWPPTGRRCETTGLSLYRSNQGRLVEEITVTDAITLLTQLGFSFGGPATTSSNPDLSQRQPAVADDDS
jgi:predicted ester cyclase